METKDYEKMQDRMRNVIPYQCLLFNDKYMELYRMNITDIHRECTGARFIDGNMIDGDNNITMKLIGKELNEIFTLDPTMMKRIAKYNKDKEFELLNAKIEVANIELQEIRNKIQRFNNKYLEIIQFIDNDFGADDDDYDDDWEESE